MSESNLMIRLHALLVDSMPLWNVNATVGLDERSTRIEICRSDGLQLSIGQTPKTMREIARWTVTCKGETSRVCSSTLGVLSVVRELIATTPDSGMPLRLGVMGITP